MKAILTLVLLFSSAIASANTEKSVQGAKAQAIALALTQANIQSYGGTDDSVTFHAWQLDCKYSRPEGVIALAECYVTYNHKESAPVVTGKKAARLIKSLLAAKAVEKFDADADGSFKIALLNLDVTNTIIGENSTATFVDMLN